MKKILILTVLLILLVPTIFYGQTKQVPKAKTDSSLIYIEAALKGVLKCSLKILITPPYTEIVISSKYPLTLNFKKLTEKTTFNLGDFVSFGNFNNIQVLVHSKTYLTAMGNVTYGMDFSSGSFNGGGFIQSGEYEYLGGIAVGGKQITFEDAKISYEDNNGLRKINEGAKCVLDGKEYYYKGGTWVYQKIN